MTRSRITTDAYPTRHAAFDAPGTWAVFEAAPDGTVSVCGTRRPRAELDAGIRYPGEMAVLSIPMPHVRFAHLTRGVYVEIGACGGAHASLKRDGFVAVCHFDDPQAGRGGAQTTARIHAATIDEAISLADAWVDRVLAGLRSPRTSPRSWRCVMQRELFEDSANEVERALADGDLFVEVDAKSCGYCPWTGLVMRRVHVISKRAGGEIRGYSLLEDGRLIIGTPCYTGEWPEMDALVERIVGDRVEPYPVSPCGAVRAPLMAFVEES